MVGQNTYVPPDYIPIGQSDAEADVVPPASDVAPAPLNDKRLCWTFLPLLSLCEDCRVYGSGMLTGSCMTHFILWDLVNSFCCVLTEGCMMGLSGCFVACYVCGYRKALRSKYNLEGAVWRFHYTFLVPFVCSVSRTQRNP